MIEFISRLPQGYQEVEYIESSGTQYIDTGFVPNDNTEIILVFTNNNAATGNYDCMFGTRTNASNANTFALWLDINRRFGAFYGTGQNMKLFPTSIDATAKHTATMKGRVAEIDGISVTCSATSSSPAYSFYIGACNTAGTADYFSKILIYESKIYDNVTLVRDFVPCYRKADNVAGLYDLVNNVFYTNAGSSVFSVGADSNKHVIATITPGGVLSFGAALRRRMMMGGEAFEFTYTGQFMDEIEGANRVIKFTSSGTLTVSGSVIADIYLLAGGGGGSQEYGYNGYSGGGGGNRTVINHRITAGAYSLTIGTGGNAMKSGKAGDGTDTTGFGYRVTGGSGGSTRGAHIGVGGTPNGGNGTYVYKEGTAVGGYPNGGSASAYIINNGGNGYITITIPV